MVKKHFTTLFLGIINILLLSSTSEIGAQEIKVFKVGDFDLSGPVKSCLVITDYGKEQYKFNEKGLLTNAITRYNDEDYDITTYKLNGNELVEKRVENYRDGIIVKHTSLANFYELDTTEGKKITEKIISYNKQFLDQYQYDYGRNGKLNSIKRINDSGIDETTITYEVKNGESTETYYLNDVILKSIRVSEASDQNQLAQKTVLTKQFLEGEPHKALEQKYTEMGKLISEVKFSFNKTKKTFLPSESEFYEYNPQGDILSVKIVKNKLERVKNYHYQYDDAGKGNWIKQILTPDNSYITRRIHYYTKVESQENKR
ncbi:hypothetical protein KCTC52924_03768 [Arenibacter antarcticus]|uniref:YD repeat-containing protein n=1 Tax=Arenibacter antarcticus TaxID=2040469 RepID=A0ABW5VFM1_9FLAO|nr:hypothetical protein [Arenibacter sp. H213]MCM4168206.1 hypothetical protein [Arenibacter sp. H213]